MGRHFLGEGTLLLSFSAACTHACTMPARMESITCLSSLFSHFCVWQCVAGSGWLAGTLAGSTLEGDLCALMLSISSVYLLLLLSSHRHCPTLLCCCCLPCVMCVCFSHHACLCLPLHSLSVLTYQEQSLHLPTRRLTACHWVVVETGHVLGWGFKKNKNKWTRQWKRQDKTGTGPPANAYLQTWMGYWSQPPTYNKPSLPGLLPIYGPSHTFKTPLTFPYGGHMVR